jgi:hypothetical protein
MKRMITFATFGVLMICLLSAGFAQAQTASTVPPLSSGKSDGTILLTIFMRHDQSKNLAEINDQLWKNGYFDKFPPEGVEVVSWYVAMGVGQIITLRLPPEKLRAVNVALEQTAWGPYRTDFYATYDYKQVAEQQRKMMREKKR